MNSVHDMGGMDGMGPIENEKDEPVFHAPWEGRAFAITRAMGAWGKWNIDASRHQRELIPAADYLRMSYYEKWIAALEVMMVKHGLVTATEVKTGSSEPGSNRMTPALTPEKATRLIGRGVPASREAGAAPRFVVGQTVRTGNFNLGGHTR